MYRLMFFAFAMIPISNLAAMDVEFILATALFYTDSQERILLVSGPLPSEVDHIIRNDLHGRVNSTILIKVVPAFHNISDIPIHKNILSHLKTTYSDMYIAGLTRPQSRKIMQDMWNSVVEAKRREYESTKVNRRDENYVNMTALSKLLPTPKTESSPEDYIPNDIYYGVEKRCVNWADGCSTLSNSILNMPSSYVKIPALEYRLPEKLHWSP